MEKVEITYIDIQEDKEQEEIIKKVLERCFQIEGMEKSNLVVTITLTTPEQIQKINKEYRKIDKPTDVLSFPMFEKTEIESAIQETKTREDVLGDIIISVEQVKRQAEEYGHTYVRELSYMIVHGFYHLMGYDHMKEEEKVQMRKKEEAVLESLDIGRE